MKTYVLLILLGFTSSVHCSCLSNVTENDPYPLCPVNHIRRKRALNEYTRWRANEETTPEFIVKILDEDLTTPKIKPIVAVNIQSPTKGGEKIIIGGAMVPMPVTTSIPLDLLMEYTRFVPPTTPPATHPNGESFRPPAYPQAVDNLTPVTPPKRFPLINYGVGKHSQRDESPPASPQFLARTPLLIARQYAPVAPVSFTRRTTMSPFTPPLSDIYSLRRVLGEPSRTTPLTEIIIPTRTSYPAVDYHRTFESLEEDTTSHEIIVTRTSYKDKDVPGRTTQIENHDKTEPDDEPNVPTTLTYHTSSTENEETQDRKVSNVEDSDTYSAMFYFDEYNENSRRKGDQESSNVYDEKTSDHESAAVEKDAVKLVDNDVNNTVPEANDYQGEDIVNFTTAKAKLVENVGMIDMETTETSLKDKLRDKRRSICSMLKLRQLNFNSPRTLPEIVTQLKQWADESPVAKWVDITDGNLTTMENPIYMMIVDDPSSGQIVSAKQTVMIVAGIQGRDHHAVAAGMYVLYQLIERSEAHADLLSKYRFWIIPVFNPDGYDYSMTFPHRREWSKNLRQTWETCKGRESCIACQTYGIRCTIASCYGVNLDRNFEYQWIPAEELRSEHPCGSLYAGARQLSEPETRALTHYLHEQRMPIYTFIAFKEGDVLGVMYPYSHTKKRRAFDLVYRQRATRAASAAHSISGRPYGAGQTSEFLPLYAGGIEDWIDGHLGIDNTYTVMMFRPTDAYNTKLITERVVHEAYAAIDTLLLQAVEPPTAPAVAVVRSGVSALNSMFFLAPLAISTVLLCS